ncbi:MULTISPECIES: nucleoside hydrolase [Pseudonocardia]|uniref:Pyrimidine-specific ribonucleoside hydrolase RihA n=2 Tax=Pseudonocardia TaxID=1847 RepID=A0A1Y2MJW9_PSEAH|nr:MULTISPECIES: nucleoside hydrolase [Pseudonocardia]OSY35586.1 Pyrimidine-specific ribonucleoside hydrolase RihA [Pseudonocardia autotrophica]TDN76877.1 pyrimidine-specific ribonucleoside hydrolase [Pseudonocardia autotrophica]BBG00880.1 purine nucleosidase [Pseudonocardia autotrophica]GEC27561.1 purine nucleosidase [Pseudonocardia saturnea]
MAERIPLIIDTDPGVDDAFAIALALHSPEVEILAVTATYGNVSLARTAANVQRILALAGRADVPTAPGAARPLIHEQAEVAPDWHGEDGLGLRSRDYPNVDAIGQHTALSVKAEILRRSPIPVTIAVLGPMTNIALLLAIHPELAPKIGRIVAMGGSLGLGNTRGAGEFNIYADPEAAHRVLAQSEVPVTLVPLDMTMSCWAGAEWLDMLSSAGPRCATLVRTADLYREVFRERYGQDAVVLHDMLAMIEVVAPGTLAVTPQPISVDCTLGPERGRTTSGTGVGPSVDVALEVDSATVLTESLRRISAMR